ncbi:MAG TPA: VOC family protein [Alphaproteobacteria bacterium]|nr:VOC family protein [Alphaproteobacteria bacterium]
MSEPAADSRPVVDHIGVIVPDLEAAVTLFTRLFGAAPVKTRTMPDVGLKIAEFAAANVTIELLQYTGEDAAFAKDVMGEAPGVNHISFLVDALGLATKTVEAAGAKPMAGFPRQGAHGQVVFFEPTSTGGVRFELCERDG